MTKAAQRIRRWSRVLRRTPLHPQWLLGNQDGTTDWIRSHARGTVLDIGCADRWIESRLPPGCEYVGLDSLVTGGSLYAARPDVFADAGRLPVREGSVDTVLMLEVLEHVRHPSDALAEVARVLRPGGSLLVTIPFLYPVHDAPHDYQRYTAHGLVRELEAAGLSVESPSPSLGSAESAGLIFNLAVGGMVSEALERRSVSLLLAPVAAVVVPVVNLGCWLLGKVMPDWEALTAGYRVLAQRP